MTDKPKPSTKKKSFPIRNFARLLDEFLEAHPEIENREGNAVTYLKAAVDDAFLEHYKR